MGTQEKKNEGQKYLIYPFCSNWGLVLHSTNMFWRTLCSVFKVLDLFSPLISGNRSQGLMVLKSMQKMRNKWLNEHLKVRCKWSDREGEGESDFWVRNFLLWGKNLEDVPACCTSRYTTFSVSSKKLATNGSKINPPFTFLHFTEAAVGFSPP